MPAIELLASKADGKRTHPSSDHRVDYLRLQAVSQRCILVAAIVTGIAGIAAATRTLN